MTLRSRRIIYITFILLFLAVTPLIVLYTAGYRYNFQKHKIQKTGILILKSKPEGAQIYLNNKLQKTTTPARIINLLPDNYQIKIEKEGFFSWEKTLPVLSGLTTFAENILLFKKQLPINLIDGEIISFSLAPNKQKIVYLQKQETGKEVWLLDLETNQKSLFYRLPDENEADLTLEWDKNSQKILLNPEDSTTLTAKYIVFDSQTQEANIYVNLEEFYFDFKGLERKFINAAQLQEVSLIHLSPRYTVTLNKTNQKLLILDNASGNIIFQTKADKAAWFSKGEKLLYLHNFELWIYDPANDQKILITRYSKEIKKALWVNDNYISLLLENTLKIIELDEREQKNVFDLATLENISDFDINTEEQKIYFIGKLGNQKGVFELRY